jgi:hypothetical protein
MKPRSTKVVALFDVLGFENLLTLRGLDRMLQDYAKLTAIVDKMREKGVRTVFRGSCEVGRGRFAGGFAPKIIRIDRQSCFAPWRAVGWDKVPPGIEGPRHT